jgi:hypothetical protein
MTFDSRRLNRERAFVLALSYSAELAARPAADLQLPRQVLLLPHLGHADPGTVLMLCDSGMV